MKKAHRSSRRIGKDDLDRLKQEEEREKAEKEARKACKNKICDILATKNPQGDDVACDIVKTWREADITKIFGGRIDWPWGGLPIEARDQAQAAGEGHNRGDLRGGAARAEGQLHAGTLTEQHGELI